MTTIGIGEEASLPFPQSLPSLESTHSRPRLLLARHWSEGALRHTRPGLRGVSPCGPTRSSTSASLPTSRACPSQSCPEHLASYPAEARTSRESDRRDLHNAQHLDTARSGLPANHAATSPPHSPPLQR